MQALQIDRILAPALALIALLIAANGSALAATEPAPFSVNSTVDATDANPGDGVCETVAGNGVCTLRAAIVEANALPGGQTVAVPAGSYELTLPGGGEPTLMVAPPRRGSVELPAPRRTASSTSAPVPR